MQIYTKILIGMAAGVCIGLFLGPRSFLLPHDTYAIRDASTIVILKDRANPNSALHIPPSVPLSLHILHVENEQQLDLRGKMQDVPAWANVSFHLTEQLRLAHDSTTQTPPLPPADSSGNIVCWLQIERIPLETGGFATRPIPVSATGGWVIGGLRPIGQLFMRLIKMVVVPLVFASLLVGVAGLGDLRTLGRLGSRTLGLYLTTTAIAVSIGLACAYIIQPGQYIDPADRAALLDEFSTAAGQKMSAAAAAPPMIQTLVTLVPTNPVEALTTGNMLQIIFFSIIFGVALTVSANEQTRQLVALFEKIQEAMIVIIRWVMALAPFGVAALVAEVIGTSGLSILAALLAYAGTVMLGLLLHATIIYGAFARLLGQVSWAAFMKAARPAQLIAFSTSSSSATLPVSMECAEQRIGVSRSISSFVLPLGSTVNMDGTALYQGVAAVFIAQVFQTDLTLPSQLTIVFAATMASVGAAGVPGAGMITLALVLTATGIPTVGIALILGLDRILDMFRTAVNVTGDLTVTTVIARREGENLSIARSARTGSGT